MVDYGSSEKVQADKILDELSKEIVAGQFQSKRHTERLLEVVKLYDQAE
jgi:hypothetical protein